MAVKVHPPAPSGIQSVKSETALKLIDRVIGKLVRVTLTDERIYLGRLMSVDQTRAVFLSDALELIDTDADCYFEHELLTPFIMKEEPCRWRLKYMGNAAIPGECITKI